MEEHPYVPRDMELQGFVPLVLSQKDILVPYLISSVVIAAICWILSGFIRRISKIDRLLMCWWLFTGLTHILVEGYFVFSPEFYKKTSPFYMDELWKEYSKGDSRYVARDSAVVTVEGITAVLEGPACLLAVYAIASKKAYSYILQFAVCLGQLYGCLVYFITAYLEGDNFSIGPLYYYAYYIVANSFWVVIPTFIAIRCWKKITRAVQNEKSKTQ